MTTYYPYGVKLSEGQRKKLAKAYRENSAITIRYSSDELQGDDQLMLTKTQIARLIKAKKKGNGIDIKISKTQIRKAVMKGGSLWSSLFSLGTKLLPYATTAVSKAAPALATGALSGLADFGVKKIFGEGQTGGYLIPNQKIDSLMQYRELLTPAQKKGIEGALHTGGGVVIKPTRVQRGGFLGTLLASIGVPLLLNALTGKGLHIEKRHQRRSIPVYVTPTLSTEKKDGGKYGMIPYQSPPFFGSWDNPIGKGIKKKTNEKKKKGKGLLLGKNSLFKDIPVLGWVL